MDTQRDGQLDGRDLVILALLIALVVVACPDARNEPSGTPSVDAPGVSGHDVPYSPDWLSEPDVALPDEQYDRYYR